MQFASLYQIDDCKFRHGKNAKSRHTCHDTLAIDFLCDLSGMPHTFFSSSERYQLGPKIVRPFWAFSPFSLRRASSALVRIFPPPSTPQGSSARPSERALGMISRSKDHSSIDQSADKYRTGSFRGLLRTDSLWRQPMGDYRKRRKCPKEKILLKFKRLKRDGGLPDRELFLEE